MVTDIKHLAPDHSYRVRIGWRPCARTAVLAVLAFVSACATTGSQERQLDRVQGPGQTNCDGASVADAQSKGNCRPVGVIEIAERYGVDPDVRNEFNQANALLNAGRYAEAIKVLKAVCGKTSKFSAPYINLGIAYAITEDYEKAEESFKKALAISERHPVAQNELGLIYRKTGRYGEARATYEQLLSLYPDFLPARKNLGVLCDIYIQDLSCALTQYEEYLKGKPDDEKVKVWVADVKSRM